MMMTVLGLSLLSCPHCDAAFPTVPTLNDHIEREHPKGISKTGMSDSGNTTAVNKGIFQQQVTCIIIVAVSRLFLQNSSIRKIPIYNAQPGKQGFVGVKLVALLYF